MIFVIGPTSSGKTSLALKLCERLNGEIISADSRQIYKHFDVGTGKLPLNAKKFEIEKNDRNWTINGVNIWLYDVCEPNVKYSVADFQRDAQSCIAEIESRKKTPIIVGGTGFYVDSFLGGSFEEDLKPNWEFRKSIETLSIQELRNRLPKNILNEMNNSDANNPHRLIRRIELLELYNVESRESKSFDLTLHKTVYLYRTRDDLFARADKWAQEIWPPLLTEVEGLLKAGYSDTTPMEGIIYKTAKEFIEGKANEQDSLERIKFDLHAYIRRQQTWFKKYEKFSRKINPDQGILFNKMASIIDYIVQ